MALREELEQLGSWFFRWRSYLPLLLGVVFWFGVKDVRYPYALTFWDRAWEIFCLLFSFLGLVIRSIAVGSVPRGSSGRNVAEQRAHALNTTGLYSISRHPLYLGNFFMWLGAALFIRSLWATSLTALIFWYYYEKIILAEEEFLRKQYGDAFLDWAKETPVFLPIKLKKWRAPELKFEPKNAIRREYSGFFAIISVFSALKLVQDRVTFGEFIFDGMWSVIFVSGFFIYVTLLVLKKKTKLLDVEGR